MRTAGCGWGDRAAFRMNDKRCAASEWSEEERGGKDDDEEEEAAISRTEGRGRGNVSRICEGGGGADASKGEKAENPSGAEIGAEKGSTADGTGTREIGPGATGGDTARVSGISLNSNEMERELCVGREEGRWTA